MRKLVAATITLALVVPAVLAGMKVKAEKEYEPYRRIILKATDVTSKSAQFLWDIDGDCDYEEDGGTLRVWAAPGTYTVRLTAIDFEAKKVERARFTFKVQGAAPKPPDPKPPDPKPPGPKPGEVNDLRVLVVYDPAKAYPKEQQLIISGQEFRNYTKSRGKPGTNGIGPARIWPKDADVSQAPKEWADLFKARTSDSALIVGDGGKVLKETTLPADTKSAIDFIEKASPKTARPKYRKAG